MFNLGTSIIPSRRGRDTDEIVHAAGGSAISITGKLTLGGKDVTQIQPANIYGLAAREGPTQILAPKATSKGQGASSVVYKYI